MGNRSSTQSDLDPNMFARTIPDDVFMDIFSFLEGKDIIRCSMVFRKWRQLIVNHRFWLYHYCSHGPLDMRWAEQLKALPINDVQRCLTLGAFGRNLIADDFTNLIPQLDSRWSDSQENRNRSNVFKIEAPPNFLHIPRENSLDECPIPFESCLVSSYQIAERSIRITFADYGLTAKILQTLSAKIVITEYFVNRADCACIYGLRTSIITDDGETNDFVQNTEVRINQWERRLQPESSIVSAEYWHKAEHTFLDVPDNAVAVEVSSRGCDRQFWAGNYGAKLAGISFRIELKEENE